MSKGYFVCSFMLGCGEVHVAASEASLPSQRLSGKLLQNKTQLEDKRAAYQHPPSCFFFLCVCVFFLFKSLKTALFGGLHICLGI